MHTQQLRTSYHPPLSSDPSDGTSWEKSNEPKPMILHSQNVLLLEYSYPTPFDRELVPLKALPTAKETATTIFHYIFRTYGLPKDIVSYRAPSSPLGFGGPSVLTSELIGHSSNSKNIIKYYWLWNTGWLGQYKGKNLDQILIDARENVCVISGYIVATCNDYLRL
ncbi:hypothetical protein QTP70_019477 [Hemibagrus guttatus]|uniref:Uncharacterized protein n=1 Tax=Hemibagrus guttatus TaxID=175788 RepID=A0AAE0Q9W0_9TELE|nr:hypothetical protein QTP70_019477 [Hemibagrus guttatus]